MRLKLGLLTIEDRCRERTKTKKESVVTLTG